MKKFKIEFIEIKRTRYTATIEAESEEDAELIFVDDGNSACENVEYLDDDVKLKFLSCEEENED